MARPSTTQIPLEELLVHTPFAMAGVDPDGTITSMSGGITEISGALPETYLGAHWTTSVHPGDVVSARSVLTELRDASDGSRRTVRFRLRSTGNRWVAVEVEVTRMLERSPGLFIATFRAIEDLGDQPDRVEAFLRSVVDVPVDAVTVIDESGRVLWVSPSTAGGPDVARADLVGSTVQDAVHPEDVPVLAEIRHRVCLGGGPLAAEVRLSGGRDAWVWTRVRITDLRDVEGVGGLVAVVSDVDKEVEARNTIGRFASVFDVTEDLVVLIDPDGAVLYANQAARDFLGGDLEHLGDREDLQEVSSQVSEALAEDGPQRWVGDVTLTADSGRTRPVSLEVLAHHDEDGELVFLSATARDITERIELHRQLQRQATHDPLTGLPNRTMLFERIHDASAALGSDPEHHIALLFIDLDHFKIINDSLGHSVGDRLLCAISRRVRTVVRPGDLVGRFGGDEFVVLCEGVESIDTATAVAGRIESTLEAPFRVDGHDIHVGVSIGIAFADEAADAEAILRDADTAMYRAKSDGRGQWVVFDDDLRRTAVQRQETESALRKTRDGDAMELHYQPIVDCSSMEVRGLEALLRWERDGVLVAPGSFMQVAEETGLIVSIGQWVLEEACGQLARFQQRQGWAELGVSVNVSARQILRPEFTSTVEAAIASAGVDPQRLSIEITETALVEDEVAAAAVLEELRCVGVVVAIDDFGTGYSSLTYLHTLPVDVVKLDRSFVEGAAADAQKRAIVEAVVNLTGVLGLASVAEGVETEDELSMLRDLGCAFAQGNLLSPAVSAARLEQFLADAGPSRRVAATSDLMVR